ncbi:MAG: hypothetical protein JXR88_09525 [Clostridia bacterium]|nr:hypothetical protein [Clostridia bacterium]
MNVMSELINADPSIAYQVKRDLIGYEDLELKARIAEVGFGKRFLSYQRENGWGERYYQPKWTSTHYTMMDLRALEIDTVTPIVNAMDEIVKMRFCKTGGTGFTEGIKESDVCVNGMMLNYLSYFDGENSFINQIVDYIIQEQMEDGGFNCQRPRSGAKHSSMHSTISVLEGIGEYLKAGHIYRKEELEKIQKASEEFLFIHHLFLSDQTGEVIKAQFLMLSFPSRWYYDILRALKYFSDYNRPYDDRMKEALEVLWSKQLKTGLWPVQKKHSGQVHFEMEKTGRGSLWNTYRALKVLKAYDLNTLVHKTLLKIHFAFEKEQIRYGIGASLLLKVHGIVESGRDIDLIVDEGSIQKALKILEHLGISLDTKSMELYQTEHFYTYNVDGIEVDVMVNFTVVKDQEIFTMPYDEKDIVVLDGLPYTSLTKWEKAYSMMGRTEKSQWIKTFLDESKSINL